jgi:hypothetical protein
MADERLWILKFKFIAKTMSIPSSSCQKSILFASIETKLCSKISPKKQLSASKKAQLAQISQLNV